MEENTNKDLCEKEKKKRKRSFVSNLILVVAILVFLFSGYKLYGIWAEYQKIDADYEEIKEHVIEKDAVTVLDQETGEEFEEVRFHVDFQELLKQNRDVVGWIRFENPETISYPIAKGDSNDEYLRHNLDKEYSTAGTIFVDYRNSSNFKDLNTFIYGHNMRNGSMFGQLKKYVEKDFFEANPYFYIYTPDGMEMTYRIFSVRIVKDTSDAFDLYYSDSKEFGKYISDARKASYFDSNAEVSTDSRIVTLSTCSKAKEDRLLIHGVKISQVLIKE